MPYRKFTCSVMRENRTGLTQPYSIKQYNKQTQGYIRKDDAKKVILLRRQIFKEALLKKKGPSIIPTIFKNHPIRYEYVRNRDRALNHVRNVRNPPKLPFYISAFADDVFLNLLCNFRENAFRAYLNHGVRAKFVVMNKESCGEKAFEEMLSLKCFFYSEFEEVVHKSQYVALDIPQLISEPYNLIDCPNNSQYIVDFSLILPEFKVSTVMVYCTDCGALLETIFCDKTILAVKKDVLHNISQADVKKVNEDTNVACSIIRLPLRSSKIQGFTMVEGLIGVTPLITENPFKPSTLVRVRLSYYCNTETKISEVVHNTKDKDIPDPEIINPDTEKFERIALDSLRNHGVENPLGAEFNKISLDP